MLHAAPARDPAREAKIEAELAQLAPAQLEAFRAARVAADAQNYAEAERQLRPVVAALPEFTPAFRRLGAALARQGKQTAAVARCEDAVHLERSAANLATLAYVVGFPADGNPSKVNRERALRLLVECRTLPDGLDEDILSAAAQLAFDLENLPEVRTAVGLLESKYPDGLSTHYLSAALAATDSQWVKAEREILAAQKAGLDPEVVNRFLDSGVHTRALGWQLAGISGSAVGIWGVGLLGLCGLGFGLSRLTLRQIERSDPTVPISPAEHRLRRLYRVVLNAAGIYYYISIPVVMLLVLGVATAVVVAFMAAGWLPIKLLLILAIGALATIWTMGRSLFLKVATSDPGRVLRRGEAEALWALTEEVARDLHTGPIDEIRITLGTDLCVYERGTWKEKLENRATRVLVLGAAVLNGFKQEDFRSVLAHEYGHFSNRDTAGGDIALRVQNDMLKFYHAMLEAGQATKLNVAFHFLRIYHFIFRRISHGATRLQEVLADRVAAQSYGSPAFEGGLRHVIRQSIDFHATADHEIKDALEVKRPLQNLYGLMPVNPDARAEEFTKALNRPTTPDDTHPGPQDRFRLISKIPAPNRSPSPGLVWDLFNDRAAIEREMMETVEKNIAPHRSEGGHADASAKA